MEPIEAYQLFQSIKWYYEKASYDYFKYGGRVSIKQDTFDRRRDKYFFHKLSKKDDLEFFLASNLFRDSTNWVGDILTAEHTRYYRERKGIVASLKEHVKNDLSRYDSFEDACVITNGEYAKIIIDYLANKIQPETLVILNDICGSTIFPYWEKECNDRFVWPTTQERIRKYGKFLDYDKNKYKNLLIDILQ